MGKRETEARQCSKTEQFTLLIQATKNAQKCSKMHGENWRDLWQQPCRAKEKIGPATRKWLRGKLRPERSQKLFMVVQWNLLNPQGNEWNLLYPQRRSQCRQRIYFDASQFVAQVHCCASSDENSGCKNCRGQGMEKARDNPSMEVGKSQEQKGRFCGSTRRQKDSPLCYIDGHMSLKKTRSSNPNYGRKEAGSCNGGTLQKTTLEPTQSLLNKARLRPR